MSDLPRISVVIPAYNGAAFIGKTIDSALAQEYPAHQVIVIDDGSTDGTPGVLSAYGDRITVRRTANSGCSAAKNAGVSLATGDYVAFLDHDDLWFKNKLKKQAELIRAYPEIGFFCCNYAVRQDRFGFRMVKQYSVLKRARNLNFDGPLNQDPFKLLIGENFIGTSSAVVVKKEIVGSAGPFDGRYRIADDLDFSFRCALHTNFVVASDVLMYKKTRRSNLSSDAIATYLDHEKVLLDTLAARRGYIAERGLLKDVRMSLARINYDAGNCFFEAGKRKRAFAHYKKGLGYSLLPENLFTFSATVFKKLVRILINDGPEEMARARRLT